MICGWLSSSKPWGCVVFSCPTGTYPLGIATHYWGQGHRWITKTLTSEQRNLGVTLQRPWNTAFTFCSSSTLFDTHSGVINVLMFSERLLSVTNWHILKARMAVYLYGRFWFISINIFKQNKIAHLFIMCPLVCLNLQNYPYRWQIVNIMQNHSPGSRPISVFRWHSPFLEMLKSVLGKWN